MNNKTKCLALFSVVGIASFLLTAADLADQYAAAADSKKNGNSKGGNGAKSVGSNNNDNNNNSKDNGARVVIHGGNLGAEFVW